MKALRRWFSTSLWGTGPEAAGAGEDWSLLGQEYDRQLQRVTAAALADAVEEGVIDGLRIATEHLLSMRLRIKPSPHGDIKREALREAVDMLRAQEVKAVEMHEMLSKERGDILKETSL